MAVRAILRDLELLGHKVDFEVCIGDGKTDEPVFTLLKEMNNTIACTVARTAQTNAEFWLEDVNEVADVLSQFCLQISQDEKSITQ